MNGVSGSDVMDSVFYCSTYYWDTPTILKPHNSVMMIDEWILLVGICVLVLPNFHLLPIVSIVLFPIINDDIILIEVTYSVTGGRRYDDGREVKW